MPEYELTPEQKRVVFSQNGNMIVSASAGTGKTTVMIDRIVRLIKEGLTEVKNLLVVTFTNAAAQEMKIRLLEKLKESALDEKMFYQLNDIDNASISTLHSFCSEVLHNYFYEADIDPAFRILEEGEILEYKNRSLDDVFDDYYQNYDESFIDLANAFGKRDDQQLRNVIFQLYNFSVTIPNFEEWSEKTLKNYTAKNNPFAKVINNNLILEAKQLIASLDNLSFKCRGLKLDNVAEFLTTISQSITVYPKNSFSENYANMAQFKSFPVFTAKLKKEITESSVEPDEKYNLFCSINELKKAAFEFLTKFDKIFFNKPIDLLNSQMKETKKPIEKLIEIVLKFSARFSELKKENGGLDFNDLELICLKILKNNDIVEEIKSKYKYVFVDEYQDINAAQEGIINLVKREDNLFLVGDIKQSIYGFRECDPMIFSEKINNNKQNDEIVFLNENFRSNSAILKFVNTIFSSTMTTDFGKENYKKNSLLKGENKVKGDFESVEITLIDKSEMLKNRKVDGVYDLTVENESVIDLAKAEAKVIASKINSIVGKQLNSGKVINYNDIVILARVTTEYTYTIYQELLTYNIPVVCESKQPTISGYEIVSLVNFLKVLDNPLDDIAIFGCLSSCLGKLSDNELAKIKACYSADNFYDSLQNYRKTNNDEIATKLNVFFDLAQRYRFLAHSKKVDELLMALIKETNYEYYILSINNGNMRLNRLYGFINDLNNTNQNLSVNKYISFLNETPSMVSDSSFAATTNAVRIMSIHHSKGLEFPIVFVCELGYKFNIRQNAVACDKTLGLATKLYNFDTMEKCNTLSYVALKMQNVLKAEEEELRVLYVALTRAKNHLFLVGCGDKQELMENRYIYAADSTNCFQWVMNALIDKFNLNKLESTALEEDIKLVVVDISSLDTKTSPQEKQVIFPLPDKDEQKKIESILAYSYKFQLETTHSKKLVSSLLKAQQGEETEVTNYIVNEASENTAEIGTAYHTLFEKVDYKNVSLDSLSKLKESCVENGEFTLEVANKVDENNIFNCLKLDEIDKRVKKGKVYRELPFMIEVFRWEILDEPKTDEKVILQGVIDMLVIENNEATIFDYKITTHPEKLAEKYRLQMRSYEVAVNKILGVTNIHKYLIDVLENKIVAL